MVVLEEEALLEKTAMSHYEVQIDVVDVPTSPYGRLWPVIVRDIEWLKRSFPQTENPLCGQQTEGERHLAVSGSAEPEVTSQDGNGETL